MGHTMLTVLCLERHLSRLVQDPPDDREESRCLLEAGYRPEPQARTLSKPSVSGPQASSDMETRVCRIGLRAAS